MKRFYIRMFALSLWSICLSSIALGQGNSASAMGCKFDFSTLSFRGEALEQARCLLRKVKMSAHLESQPLPTFIEENVDKNISVTKTALRKYLTDNGINENDIGGSLDNPVSRGRDNSPTAPFARYFVIHDTSSPNLKTVLSFPENINESLWIFNDPQRYRNSKQAHLFITRDGQSIAPQGRTFNIPWRATKLDLSSQNTKGMFLHIENVQPRRCLDEKIRTNRCMRLNSRGEEVWNDSIAPAVGFSEPQLKRLALVYIAASVRRGKWLIPAFHATIDDGFDDGHDDPQNFDLQKWSNEIEKILNALPTN